MVNEKIRDFWNQRAELGEISGSNDYLLKNLEFEQLRKRIPDNSSVLDVGCGNGETLAMLAKDKNCTGVGIDFSPKMVELAKQNAAKNGVEKNLKFIEGALENIPESIGLFNCVITERSIINLDSEEKQHKAFIGIMNRLKDNGRYYMIESCLDGLERTNELRVSLGLEAIAPPWHNLFLRQANLEKWADEKYVLEEVCHFSSTYHLLSRVVYAKIAQDKKEELRYDSDINLVSCKLPAIGDYGPVKLWQWRRNRGDK
jgi:ubiquinone/menaquinone biosynthesis C-methylase UbiE